MGKALRITLIVIGFLVVAGGLVFAGTWIGHRNFYGLGWPQSGYRMMNTDRRPGTRTGPGMMGSGYGPGMMGSGVGYGMMNGGSGRSYGPGMMGGYGYNWSSVTPLTVDQAYQAAGKYLAALNIPDLKIAEVMVFDNNAYVRVVEQSTGIGAFELLVDPASLAVTPEPGPNMMWNLKYSGLNHQYMMGGRNGMLGGSTFNATPPTVSATMPVTSAQALQAAQQFLDTGLPGTKTAADADPFYGYHTIDILRDGKIIGMLSVNGTSSQVFLHTWHGTFIATQDY
ncbi:MAG TPA: hypothetical protein VF359_11275 [Anaerolineales bacterium]